MDYDTTKKSFYIYNQNTNNELKGILYCGDIDENYCTLEVKKEYYLGNNLANFISVDESELIEHAETLGFFDMHPEWLRNSPLSSCLFYHDGNIERLIRQDIKRWADSISSIRRFIDICIENDAFFRKEWLNAFLDAEKIAGKLPKVCTEVEYIGEVRLYDGEMVFPAIKPRDILKVNRSSGCLRRNKESSDVPFFLTPEQKRVSKTALAIETYENPIACIYRSLEILVEKQILPKRCKNCDKYFIADKRSDTLYCNRPAPQNATKNCKVYGAEVQRKKISNLVKRSRYTAEYTKQNK